MSLTDMNADQRAVLAAEALKYRGIEKAVFKVGTDVFDGQIGHGSSTARQFAIEKAITAMRAYARKSQADATRDAESHDFDIFPSTQSPGQRSAAATRALQVQGLAQAATRRLQAMGVDNPTDDDVERAIAAVLNVSVVNREGQNGITVDNSNPQVAANMREREHNDGTIWELTDIADPRQQDAVDEEMAANAVASNFAGLRNLGYTTGRSAMPDATNFSGGAGGSVPVAPAGTSAGPTVSGASIEAVAQAAYAAGLAAGSNFAKAKRGRR